MEKFSINHIPSLDGVRALSILIVIAAHAGISELIPGGFGVTVFFFLSGFLITTLLIKEYQKSNTIHLGNFFVRRVFRLFPPLIVTLAIAYGLAAMGWLPGEATLTGFVAQIAYFANYFMLFFGGSEAVPEGTGVLWSLAVEEHFYLVYPLLMVVLLTRVSWKSAAYFLAFTCVAVLLWRYYLVLQPGFHESRTYYATDTRIDSILFGCILAILWNPVLSITDAKSMPRSAYAWMAASMAVILLSFVYREPVFRDSLRYTIQGLALMPIFYIAIKYHNVWMFRWLSLPAMRTLGLYSYAMYLLHFVVIHFLLANGLGEARPLVIFGLTVAVAVLYGYLIERFVDQYSRKLRHRLHAKANGTPRIPAYEQA